MVQIYLILRIFKNTIHTFILVLLQIICKYLKILQVPKALWANLDMTDVIWAIYNT